MALVVQHPKITGAQTSQSKETGVAESSYIQAIAYDSAVLQLTVTLKNGGQYTFFNVYPQTHEDFIQAPSKGKFFATVIKGKYSSSRPINKNVGRSKKNAI